MIVILDFNRTLFDPEKNQFFPETENLLNLLKNRGYKLTLIAIEKSEERLKRISVIKSYFDFIKIVKEKKESDFKEILEKFNCQPQEAIVIGDRVKIELKIGNKLNINTIWIKQGKFSTETPEEENEVPKLVFKNLAQLITFLNNETLTGVNTK
jgi:FMN phosphatase YigB (HAD superfamily)